MPKLNQILAIEKGTKTTVYRNLTDANKLLGKEDLYTGISREYTPIDDEGEKLPSELKKPQLKIADLLKATIADVSHYWDLAMTKETANTNATASITVTNNDTDVDLAIDVPVTMLLFLEKQLVDMRTIVSNIPILNPSFDWVEDPLIEGSSTTPVQSIRSRKVPKVLVRYEATEHHPAQTEVFNVDEPVGSWATKHFSTAIAASEKTAMLKRVDQLIAAVKKAREAANSIEAPETKIANNLMKFIFGDDYMQ